MIGAIAGDIIGSPYEAGTLKTLDFPLFSTASTFTDDTIMTVATAEAILDRGGYREAYQRWFRRYPHAGFGGMFYKWATRGEELPYNSFGNGSAMRISPIGFAFDTLEAVLTEAERSSAVTHDHPEGIKGAQAAAACVFLARTGAAKADIAEYATRQFGYVVDEPMDSIRAWYSFDVSCQGTLPVAIRAFLESEDWEHAVRLAISAGGDSDTLACITGAIAEAFYVGVPDHIRESVRELLGRRAPDILSVMDAFDAAYRG